MKLIKPLGIALTLLGVTVLVGCGRTSSGTGASANNELATAADKTRLAALVGRDFMFPSTVPDTKTAQANSLKTLSSETFIFDNRLYVYDTSNPVVTIDGQQYVVEYNYKDSPVTYGVVLRADTTILQEESSVLYLQRFSYTISSRNTDQSVTFSANNIRASLTYKNGSTGKAIANALITNGSYVITYSANSTTLAFSYPFVATIDGVEYTATLQYNGPRNTDATIESDLYKNGSLIGKLYVRSDSPYSRISVSVYTDEARTQLEEIEAN